ncbi:outer membrane lipid asymmetry maintenance protein MlaD [Neptunicoccus cionae]|uniref:Outer membrane lipid asymmetry maintenance protein MlaD n=1 Tax=Neptunicoccus cionae TaxID=2035344 RepID=A0A916QTJ8_9RHOB|nr:outer membrane lipid asymmetry maintenance protein MlaD [Amylibacter cionae]GGA10077.1 outer membrane lipid asymmetry maintenance protein MlaD [Amylibacter cionae]
MANSAAETAIGAVVLIAATGFLYYAANAVGVSGTGDSYTVNASFRSVEGISLGTDVRLAGVKIGTVTGLDLNPQTFRAETALAVGNNIVLPDDSSVVIASEGLLGGNFVEIVPGGSEFNLEDGGELLDTQGAVSLISLLLKFVSGSSE